MGVSLLFGATGTLSLAAFPGVLSLFGLRASMAGLFLSGGVALIIAAFFLKAAVVPFHAWAPDAYQGATVPVTAYMATLVKGAVLLAAVRLFGMAQVPPALAGLIVALPLASIVWGNLAAIRQPSFRRMIAYSSIAHAGYLFLAFLGAPAGRFQAVAFYVAAYALANLLAFAALPRLIQDETSDRIDAIRGLFARSPFAALMLGLAMLSLAGIPPLPGFVAKFLIFRNVMEAGYPLVATIGLVGSYLGIYFYLRAIQYAFMSTHAEAVAGGGMVVPARGPAIAAAVICLVPVALLMLFPNLLLARL
jgi:NADH-quinone oxidoreductase subunit N